MQHCTAERPSCASIPRTFVSETADTISPDVNRYGWFNSYQSPQIVNSGPFQDPVCSVTKELYPCTALPHCYCGVDRSSGASTYASCSMFCGWHTMQTMLCCSFTSTGRGIVKDIMLSQMSAGYKAFGPELTRKLLEPGTGEHSRISTRISHSTCAAVPRLSYRWGPWRPQYTREHCPKRISLLDQILRYGY
jgi:hypothetical protein